MNEAIRDKSEALGGDLGSLWPSQKWADDLPFGPPPRHLETLQEEASPMESRLGRRIRALVTNAGAFQDSSAIKAATCLHEAGRVLEKRAGRPADAWVCHSRALDIAPDHKPSRDALRRLARRSGDAELLSQLINAQLGRSAHPAEMSVLLSELAVMDYAEGRHDQAIDTLREAMIANPDALVPLLLMLNVSVQEEDDDELAETLRKLVVSWPEPRMRREIRLVLALLEERLGRFDRARDYLEVEDPELPPSPPLLWARVRIASRTNERDAAEKALSELVSALEPGALRDAFVRWRLAMSHLSEEGGVESEQRPEGLFAEIEVLDAVRCGDRARHAAGLASMAGQAQNPAWRSALRLSELVVRWGEEQTKGKVFSKVEVDSAAARTVASLLNVEFDTEIGSSHIDADLDPAALLHISLSRGDFVRAADELHSIREQTTESVDRWALAVAEASLRHGKLGRSDEALATLHTETLDLGREPLGALVRLGDRKATSLAELAVAQAQKTDDDSWAAWLLSWAAKHLEPLDEEEAKRLYKNAAELCPSNHMALAGLGRLGVSHRELADRSAEAAATLNDPTRRAEFLVRAGFHHILAGDHSRAAALFGKAYKLAPQDTPLWRFAVRFAMTHLRSALSSHVLVPPKGHDPDLRDMLALGALGLEIDFQEAEAWFSKAAQLVPEDPIAQKGLVEALFDSGKSAVVTEKLFGRMREAGDPEEEAAVYLRIADVDRRFGERESAAILSLIAVTERLPGHASTLVRLALHYAKNRSRKELSNTLARLAAVTRDDRDAAMLGNAAWHASQEDFSVLRTVVRNNPEVTVELLELEGRVEDAEERRALLQRIVERLEDTTTFAIRLAAAHVDCQKGQAARDVLQNTTDRCQGNLSALVELAILLKMQGDFKALIEVLDKLAEAVESSQHRIEVLMQAAFVARDELFDPRRAAGYCLQVLELDPKKDEAYVQGKQLLDPSADPGLSASLIEAHIKGQDDPMVRRGMHLELVPLFLRSGRREEAKLQLAAALEILPDDFGHHRMLADLHRDDQQWTQAIEHFVTAAKLCEDREAAKKVFFALGELYMDHSEHEDLAEKSFLKILGWDQAHVPSLERLASLYTRLGNPKRAAQALEQLIRLASDDDTRIVKMVELAELIENSLARPEQAEHVLVEASRIDPLDLRPFEALFDMLRRQGDALSLEIQLDRAIASQAAALKQRPGVPQLYRNLEKLWRMRNEEIFVTLAKEALALLEETESPDGDERVHWDVGGRIGESAYDDYWCPKSVPAGLRETLGALEEPIARFESVSAEDLTSARDAKLPRKHPLISAVGRMVPQFGLQAPNFYVSNESGVRIFPGDTPSVVVPKTVADSGQMTVHLFTAAFALQTIRLGLALVTVIPRRRLRLLVAGAMRMLDGAYFLPDREESETILATEGLRPFVGEGVLRHIRPFSFDCRNALASDSFGRDLSASGYRSGFMAAGSLIGAVDGLRAFHSAPDTALADLPGAGSIMAFAFSRDHVELRKRLGI